MSRDSQRQRLYNAEQYVRSMLDAADHMGSRTVNIHGSKIVLPIERKFGDLSTVQSYIDRILNRPDIRRVFPDTSLREVHVRFRKGQGMAHYQYSKSVPEIAIPIPKHGQGWAMREVVVLHELAHHLAIGNQHGEEFAGTLIYLVEEFIGPEVAFLLQDSFRVHSVQWQPVRDNDNRPEEATPSRRI